MDLSSAIASTKLNLRAMGHYLDQPNVVRSSTKVAGVAGVAGLGALMGYDAWKAQPQERKKVLIRDGIVLGATTAGTLAAAAVLMKPPSKKLIQYEMKELGEKLANLKDQYPVIQELLKAKPFEQRQQLSVREFKDLIKGMRDTPKLDKALDKAKIEADLDELLPIGKNEVLEGKGWELPKAIWQKLTKVEQKGEISVKEGELWKMRDFFSVGLASVISGGLGGVLANKVNKVQDPDAIVNMCKEGIFQFVANIALCAVGASIGLVTVELPQVQQLLQKLDPAVARVGKFGIIGTGLSLGILGGGKIANQLGTKVVNPFFDKLQGKAPQPQNAPEKRRIEFADAILHVDDLPTALALAGMEIMEPFIPLFFAFSGYRTGIGYRNHESATNGASTAKFTGQVIPPLPPQRLQANGSQPTPMERAYPYAQYRP
ncbi:hypothetical protein [Vampirovibrio chlorellavorus]|uniref:hypothetical protein n=1 Tax=Vampirovibrio chlorellavorus TaxID=758823 RepID=UPI0026EAD2FA|nr:hypothetical protein [Vampirovibrio chlorellavorus]